MAIYQFQLVAIPSEAVIDKFGYIPEQLEIDYEERTHHYYLDQEGLLEQNDVFRDALTQDWWQQSDLLTMELVHEMDKQIRRAYYGTDTLINWKFNDGTVDHDAMLLLNPADGKIRQFSFRTDLREPGWKLLRRMLELAQKFDWLLMDMEGRLAVPKFEEIRNLAVLSNAFKFLENPRKFLDELVKKHRDQLN